MHKHHFIVEWNETIAVLFKFFSLKVMYDRICVTYSFGADLYLSN